MSTVDKSLERPPGVVPLPHQVTAVVPARNAADLLPGCLTSLRDSGVAEIIVVDGLSSDDTIAVAQAHGATVISDDGMGLPVARARGAKHAQTRWVVLVDADVVFPAGVLASLLDEYAEGEFTALQAGLLSVAGPGYWGQALVHHHRTGRSHRWFGLVATVFEREVLTATGFDDSFSSGEDIELRWRMRDAGQRTGVSRQAVVEHRFAGDDYAFARSQFLMDGAGFGGMLRKHGWRGLPLALLPAAAAARGMALCLLRLQPRWLLYFAAFAAGNYTGMWRGLRR